MNLSFQWQREIKEKLEQQSMVLRGGDVRAHCASVKRMFSVARPQTVPLVSTLDLLSEWAEAAHKTMNELRSAMDAMRTGASYVPGRRDPRFEWWLGIMQEEA